jgi:FkbM family methyltransferase
VTVARSDRFRQPGVLERLGDALGETAGGRLRRVAAPFFRTALTVWTAGRGLACTLPTGDVISLHPASRHASWNADECRAFRAAVRPGAVALDVGANVGCYALALGRWVWPGGHVYAFEPAPAAFELLRRHVRLNRQTDVISPVALAVSDRPGTARFCTKGAAGGNRLAGEAAGGIAVAVTTIDAFCTSLGLQPDFIKIDVEGAELHVLRGARQTIGRGAARLALFVEMHPALWPALGISRADVLAELDRQGLEAEGLDGRTGDEIWVREGVCLNLRYRTRP